MIDVEKLRCKMKLNRITLTKLAKRIGISHGTLTDRFKRGIFKSNEIEIMIEYLDIKSTVEVIEIFFPSCLELPRTLVKQIIELDNIEAANIMLESGNWILLNSYYNQALGTKPICRLGRIGDEDDADDCYVEC